MKLGKIIGCHNKIDDLMLYLEALKYCHYQHEIIIITSMDYDEIYTKEIKRHHHRRIETPGHYIGPLLCLIAGVKEAARLGCDYILYTNADDIVYNFKWEINNFNILEKGGYLCGGYNWLNVGTYHDITLNQLYMHVPSFMKTVDDAEAYFRRSPENFLCEYKMARWIKRTCRNLSHEFYRLPGREQEPGVGWERKDIIRAFMVKGISIPQGFWDRLENNNRFFNSEWQLIGSHDIISRLNYWRKIRAKVPYGRDIEKEPNFSRFVECVKANRLWNLPVQPSFSVKKPTQKTKLYLRKIF